MKDIVSELQRMLEVTLPYFDLSEENLAKSYAPGKWTIRQLLHHITDAELVLRERICRGLANPGQVVYGFHQDAWASHMDYATRPMEVSKQLLKASRASIAHLAEQFYESRGENQYVHSETGLRIVREEFDKVVWHNEHHLRQIEEAMKH
ncbi:MAG: DinB family protein [Bacteroidota bacterium]